MRHHGGVSEGGNVRLEVQWASCVPGNVGQILGNIASSSPPSMASQRHTNPNSLNSSVLACDLHDLRHSLISSRRSLGRFALWVPADGALPPPLLRGIARTAMRQGTRMRLNSTQAGICLVALRPACGPAACGLLAGKVEDKRSRPRSVVRAFRAPGSRDSTECNFSSRSRCQSRRGPERALTARSSPDVKPLAGPWLSS